MTVKRLTYTALMTAFILITTLVIQIPVPFTSGYIHMGDACIFIAGILLGPIDGAIAAGLGSALSDFLGGYVHWVVPTLIIKSFMGFLVGAVAQKRGRYIWGVLAAWAFALAGLFILLTQIDQGVLVASVEALSQSDSPSELLNAIKIQLIIAAVSLPLLAGILTWVTRRYGLPLRAPLAMIVAGIWMVAGYYVAAGIIYGNFLAPIFSIPWNIVQFSIGILFATLALKPLKSIISPPQHANQ